MEQPTPPSAAAPVPWGTLAALVGALIVGGSAGSMIFPREHIVEKPIEVTVEKRVEVPVEKIVEKQVERIVEKPVEVVRTVEKRVEVPAKLTKEQEYGAAILESMLVADRHEIGYDNKAIFPAQDKKIKIFVTGSDAAFRKLDKSEIAARVESVFRRDGFTVVEAGGEYCETVVWVEASLLLSNDGISLSGSLEVQIQHNVMAFAGGLWKRAGLRSGIYGKTIDYGSSNFYKIPAIFESLAIQASNDLSKAGPTPERKSSK